MTQMIGVVKLKVSRSGWWGWWWVDEGDDGWNRLMMTGE